VRTPLSTSPAWQFNIKNNAGVRPLGCLTGVPPTPAPVTPSVINLVALGANNITLHYYTPITGQLQLVQNDLTAAYTIAPASPGNPVGLLPGNAKNYGVVRYYYAPPPTTPTPTPTPTP